MDYCEPTKAANFLPAQLWACKLEALGEEVDFDGEISAPSSFDLVLNSESWDSSQLRSWVKVTVKAGPSGLQTVSAVVEEWLWIGPPGPLDGLPLPDQRDMFWSAEEIAPGMWRQSLGYPSGQPIAVMGHLMKMVEWMGVDAPLSLADTSCNAPAREAQARADERAEKIRRAEDERLAHNQRHADFLLTPEGEAYTAQVQADWKQRMADIEAAGMRTWCQCSGPGCTCGRDPSSPYNPANSHPTREDLQAAYLRGLNERH